MDSTARTMIILVLVALAISACSPKTEVITGYSVAEKPSELIEITKEITHSETKNIEEESVSKTPELEEIQTSSETSIEYKKSSR